MSAGRVKKLVLSALLLSPLAFAVHAGQPAPSQTQFQPIALDEFMQGQLEGRHDIPIPVPRGYAALENEDPLFYSYWMRPEDMPQALSTSDLPGANGYMYGKISEDVAYDAATDTFVGIEDEAGVASMMTAGFKLSLSRYAYRETPVLVFDGVSSQKLRICGAYIVLDNAGNLAYVAYRPAANAKRLCSQFVERFAAPLIITPRP